MAFEAGFQKIIESVQSIEIIYFL